MGRGYPDWGKESARLRFSETVGAKLYEQTITSPRATVVGSPTTQDMTLEKGEVSWVQIRFPKGPSGLLHIAIFAGDGTTQLWPGGTATWFVGDDETVEFDTEYKIVIQAAAYKLVLKAYNEDDTYPHSALVRAWVIPYPA